MTGFKGIIYWRKRKNSKGWDKYKEGNQTPLPNMELVSVDKYHPFPASDGDVFKKAVHGAGIEFAVCFFKVFVMIQFNLNNEINFEYCFYFQTP